MGSYIFHISILLYRWLEFPYSKSLYGLMGYVVNDLMLDMICYFYLILVSWCGCCWSYDASEATNVLVLYTYCHDVFFMRCFSNLWAITIIYFYMLDCGCFFNGFFWVLVLVGPIVYWVLYSGSNPAWCGVKTLYNVVLSCCWV
jgi:hypothetical protein